MARRNFAAADMGSGLPDSRGNCWGLGTTCEEDGEAMTRIDRRALRERAESIFRTATPAEREDALTDYKARRERERQRMLELRRQRLERDEE